MIPYVEPWRAGAVAIILWFGVWVIGYALDRDHITLAGLCFGAMVGALAGIIQQNAGDDNPKD